GGAGEQETNGTGNRDTGGSGERETNGSAAAVEGAVSRIAAAGFVLRSVYRGPVPEGRVTLDALLRKGNTPGISDIDTRALTLKLRDEGSRTGVIVTPSDSHARTLSEDDLKKAMEYLRAFPSMVGRNLVTEVGTRSILEINPQGRPHIALLDCGSKANIVRELTSRDCHITVLPSTVDSREIAAVGADAVLVSNGPGDPAVLAPQIQALKELVGETPLLGICLGHQLLSHAVGAETEKMKFGHHGVNHPVRDEKTGRVFVTSQNHGFTVREDSLPDGVGVWFRNANDGSIEGISSDEQGIYTAQFHPESSPGPDDSSWIFDSFLSHIGARS
ncbi:MAG: carbamoyl phosphate synthase small subunit, partial [bacterium]